MGPQPAPVFRRQWRDITEGAQDGITLLVGRADFARAILLQDAERAFQRDRLAGKIILGFFPLHPKLDQIENSIAQCAREVK